MDCGMGDETFRSSLHDPALHILPPFGFGPQGWYRANVPPLQGALICLSYSGKLRMERWGIERAGVLSVSSNAPFSIAPSLRFEVVVPRGNAPRSLAYQASALF